MFENRTRAGDRLAERMREAGVDVDLVLAIPRGALPVGRAVADAFEVPLDVVAAKKLGAPGNPELAIGAVASDGSEWLNERLVDDLGIDDSYVDRERSAAAQTAREKADRYRRGRAPLDLAGKRVAIVDDGVATGATMHACIAAARNAGAERVVVAVPVGAPDSLAELSGDADEVLAVERPARFGAVGQFYRQFDQISDEEALTYLE